MNLGHDSYYIYQILYFLCGGVYVNIGHDRYFCPVTVHLSNVVFLGGCVMYK